MKHLFEKSLLVSNMPQVLQRPLMLLYGVLVRPSSSILSQQLGHGQVVPVCFGESGHVDLTGIFWFEICEFEREIVVFEII